MTRNNARTLSLAAAILTLASLAQPTTAAVVINEIDANQTGSTDPFEFVELAGPANLGLNGYAVVFFNGATDTSYQAFDLDGYQLGPTGFFLLGNTSVVPTADIIFPNTTLQNGADAVALYLANATDFPNGTPVTSTNLIDAIVYGSSSNPVDTDLLTALNQTTQFIDTDTTSISRTPDGSGVFTNDTIPSPMNSGVPQVQVPEPAAILLILQLSALLFTRRATRVAS